MIRAQNYLIVHQKQFLICLFFKAVCITILYCTKIVFFTPFDYSSFYKKFVKFEVEYEFEINEFKICSETCLRDFLCVLILFSGAMYSFRFV